MISVIIPAYNAAETIANALASVAPPAGVDIEIIVVDDCSTDHTGDRVAEWQRDRGTEVQGSESRVQSEERLGNRPQTLDLEPLSSPCNSVALQPCHPATLSLCHSVTPLTLIRLSRNSGPAAARNAGIRAAQGEWIAFLDSDDEWLPGKLQAQWDGAQAHPTAALICTRVTGETLRSDKGSRGKSDRAAELQGEHSVVASAATPDGEEDRGKRIEGGNVREAQGRAGLPGRPHEESPPGCGGSGSPALPPTGVSEVLPLESFIAQNPVCTSSVLVRRDALLKVGGFDESFKGPEDYDLWIRLAARFTLLCLDAPYVDYRKRARSLSMDDRRFLPQVLRVLDKAYGNGGGLHGRPGHRESKGYQCLCAAWMALERRSPGRAFLYFLKANALWPLPFRFRNDLKLIRVKCMYGIIRSVLLRHTP